MICLKSSKNSRFIILLIVLFLVLPFMLFGKDCIITIHDNLDSNIPWLKYVRDNNYFFQINTKSTTLDNLSTLYFAGDFTFKGFLYYIFDEYIAYTILYVVSIVVGFISMKLLLSLIFESDDSSFILSFVSLMYAALPVFPGYRIAIATLPLGFYLIYSIFKSFKPIYYLIAFLFPFFSVFESVLIFLLGYWFIFIIITFIIYKKLSIQSIICFALMSIGAVIANLRLFLLRFIYSEPLNRDIVSIDSISGINIKKFVHDFLVYFAKGYEHANSVHLYLILPISFFVFPLIIREIILNYKNSKSFKVNKYFKIIFVCLIVIGVQSLIISLNEQAIIYKILKIILPPLSGLSFARLYVFNNVLWYIVFASILIYIFKNRSFVFKIISCILIFLQLFIIIFKDNNYQDSWKSWKANLLNCSDLISYNEFFSTELFDLIKKDIDYRGEIVAAVGYHPSVLMYNGFNNADGYISVYPKKDALKFKQLIQPELDVNNWANHYYTTWPGRRYIYNRNISYEPTKLPYSGSIELKIDMDTFINYYQGKYIISRAKISNADEMNLELVNSYKIDKYIYELHVYKTK